MQNHSGVDSVEAEALEGRGQKSTNRQGLPQSNDQPSLTALPADFFDSIDHLRMSWPRT